MSLSRFIIIIVVLGIIGSFFAFDFGDYLTLAYVKSQQAALNEMVATQPLEIAAAFFFIYIAVTAASLPGAAILALCSVFGGVRY
jgi:uncharacterized membrane protein YdjX (TVP38/TMEM64 family)